MRDRPELTDLEEAWCEAYVQTALTCLDAASVTDALKEAFARGKLAGLHLAEESQKAIDEWAKAPLKG